MSSVTGEEIDCEAGDAISKAAYEEQQKAEEESEEAQDDVLDDVTITTTTFGSGTKDDEGEVGDSDLNEANDLLDCIRDANGDTDKIEACNEQFDPANP